ncbi:META domain-containing protein [Wenyingzhuangia sp. IMCC45467]
MKLRILILIVVCISILESCTSTKNNVFWVSGIKTTCVSGAGKTNCLEIFKGDSLVNPTWENFYAPIHGFNFEEGYLKKIEVKKEKSDPKNVPADASSITYTLVKELEKQKDIRVLLEGSWVLGSINNHPINRMVRVPSLKINLRTMNISGNGGCNQYSGNIKRITSNTFNLGNIISTQKACLSKNIESEYLKALNDVNTYHIKGSHLIFYNHKGEIILSFIKDQSAIVNQRLHDIWMATRINGTPINRMVSVPRLEINLSTQRIMGNDGCNDFSADINTVTQTKLGFSTIVSTKKMCIRPGVEAEFIQAMNTIKGYKLDGLNLILTDINGKEVLSFLKVD